MTTIDTLTGLQKPIKSTGAALHVTGADGAAVATTSSNITTKTREAFETHTPGVNWVETKGSGDIVQVDGNTAGASYIVISKDPLTSDTTTSIERLERYDFPIDLSIGLSRSQAVVGTEFSVELVDDQPTLTPNPDLTISSIQQATTVLTVTTTTPHGLVPGKRIQISGCADSRLNYQALVVASIPTPTQFTSTAGPAGTIPSLSVGPYTSGVVAFRSALGFSENGTSMIFENATVTNASFYIRSEAGDANMSGTAIGNHAVTVGTTAPLQLVNAASAYSFQPTTEYRLSAMVDRVQWMDAPVDATGQAVGRFNRTQIVPSINHSYKLRIRATNSEALTRPTAAIVSITKAGSTTWTVTTATAHGLNALSFINIYGNRDTANFPNLTTATQVASIVSPTSFTVVSTTGTATGYGGTVYMVNGGVLPSALGASAQVGVSVSRTSNIVTAVVSAAFTGAVIGDYVNLHGWRSAVNGSDIGVDGPYRVQNIATTTITLEPIGTAPTGADIVSVNCGGTVIKRTDLRISFVRVLDYERLRIEALARPSADMASALPVVLMGGTTAVTVGTGGIAVAGTAAAGSTASGNPVQIGVVAATAIQTARTAGQIVAPSFDKIGRYVGSQEQIRDLTTMAPMVTLTSTTETTIVAAVAAIFNDLRSLLITNTSATGVRVDFRHVAAGTIVFSVWVPATSTQSIELPLVAKQATVNTAWTAQLSAAVTDVRITAFAIQVN